MIGLTEFTAIVYAPSIPLTWANLRGHGGYLGRKTGAGASPEVFADDHVRPEVRPCARFSRVPDDHGWQRSTTTLTARRNLHWATQTPSLRFPTLLRLQGKKLMLVADPVSAYVKAHLSSKAITASGAHALRKFRGPSSNLGARLLIESCDRSLAFDTDRFANVELRMDTQDSRGTKQVPNIDCSL